MRRATIDATGRLDLGDAARCIGFAPGAVVDVIVTRAGSLILALSDDAVVIDLDPSRLPAGPARAALTRGGGKR